MDLHLPGLDGLEATRRIRAAEAERQRAPRTPIIALTANAFAEDREACFAAGMDGFLVKPLNREHIASTLAGLAGEASLAALKAVRKQRVGAPPLSSKWSRPHVVLGVLTIGRP